MNNIVCAIAKNENNYINEGCHHYINMGFSHIYIYDNNDSTTPYIGNFIDKEILSQITIINKQNKRYQALQLFCYQDCYDTRKFDGCLFCDIDEFLMGIQNINEFLKQEKFNTIEQIKILGKCFGDNDVIKRDISIPVVTFFTKEALTLRRPMVKCLVKSNIPGFKIKGCHTQSCCGMLPLKTCLPSGKLCNKEESLDDHLINPSSYNEETIFINHYITKSLDEFLALKYNTDDPCFKNRPRLFEDYYGKYNLKTPEKEAYIKKYLEEHNLSYR